MGILGVGEKQDTFFIRASTDLKLKFFKIYGVL